MNDDRSRLDVLLVDRATGDLDAARESELRELLSRYPEVSADEFEWVVAESVAALAIEEPLPAALRDRVLAEAAEGGEDDAALPLASTPVATKPRWMGAIGWAAAAAVGALWWLSSGGPGSGTDALALREALLAEGSPALAWAATEDPAAAGASGDVVWSESDQAGVMRIRGLTANDPTVSQYQLWIFDADRDERFPVDGGVFDIPATGEDVLVPIDPRLPVGRATLFAITVEPPGGVVVSSRERIVLTAQPAG